MSGKFARGFYPLSLLKIAGSAHCLVTVKWPVLDSEIYAGGLELAIGKLLLLLLVMLLCLFLLPLVAVGLVFFGILAILAWPLTVPLAAVILIVLGILLIITGVAVLL
jgi:hypothetical protein